MSLDSRTCKLCQQAFTPTALHQDICEKCGVPNRSEASFKSVTSATDKYRIMQFGSFYFVRSEGRREDLAVCLTEEKAELIVDALESLESKKELDALMEAFSREATSYTQLHVARQLLQNLLAGVERLVHAELCTPEAIAAREWLQKIPSVHELECVAESDSYRRELEHCMNVFLSYERVHRIKAESEGLLTPAGKNRTEKADENKAHAARIEALLLKRKE